jgi:hypothetical protein
LIFVDIAAERGTAWIEAMLPCRNVVNRPLTSAQQPNTTIKAERCGRPLPAERLHHPIRVIPKESRAA